MARRRVRLFDSLVAAPWPTGLIVGVAGFLLLRYGLPTWLLQSGSPYTQLIGSSFRGALAPLAWVFLVMGSVASLISALNAAGKRRLLETRTGIDSLREWSWREFEWLVGELFRRRGYSVVETGGGGADGGVDLLLRKDGRVELVQCKQWKRSQVPVSVAREVFGLQQHHQAHKAWIVCCGGFTREALDFVRDKQIELLSGEELMHAIDGVRRTQFTGAADTPTAAPVRACPACASPMVQRTNRRTGQTFWGCSTYPRCRGTQES